MVARVLGFLLCARRGGLTGHNAQVVGIARRSPGPRHGPEVPPAATERYEGLWVALKDGEVVAAARTSRELVYALAKLGPAAKGATMQRVPSAERGLLVGLG